MHATVWILSIDKLETATFKCASVTEAVKTQPTYVYELIYTAPFIIPACPFRFCRNHCRSRSSNSATSDVHCPTGRRHGDSGEKEEARRP